MKYVALLRGIGPGNPKMHGAKLKWAMEELGFKNVQTLLSSGNVIFESSVKDAAKLEAKIQAAWPKKLGFNSMTIVRSQAQLEALAAADPYKGAAHGNISKSYLLVTFFKSPPAQEPQENYYRTLGVNALCSSVDNSGDLKTPNFMADLDKQFGKDQITSRTWLTVQRILAKMTS